MRARPGPIYTVKSEINLVGAAPARIRDRARVSDKRLFGSVRGSLFDAYSDPDQFAIEPMISLIRRLGNFAPRPRRLDCLRHDPVPSGPKSHQFPVFLPVSRDLVAEAAPARSNP